MAGLASRVTLPLIPVDGFDSRSVAIEAIFISQRFMHTAHFGFFAVADRALTKTKLGIAGRG